MTTLQFNSKGQRIEELDCQPFQPFRKVEPNNEPFRKVDSENIRAPFQSPKPVSPKRFQQNPLFKKVEQNGEDLALSSAEPFSKVEEEILAWSEYYLNNKKKETKLNHIYFSRFNKSGTK